MYKGLSIHVKILACLFFFGAAIFQVNNKDKFKKFPKQYRIDLAAEQEYLLTKDPNLTIIPKQRLVETAMSNHLKKNISDDDFEWKNIGPSDVAGRVRTIFHAPTPSLPNQVYIGSASGGIWKSEDITDNNPGWEDLSAVLPNLSVCAINKYQDQMIFGTGEGYFNSESFSGAGIFELSENGDAAVFNSTTDSDFRFVQDITVVNDDYIFAATKNDGLQRSTNGGATWQKVLGAGKYASVNSANNIIQFADGELIASMGVQETDGIYFSTNNGNSWEKRMSGLPTSDYSRIEIAVSSSNNKTVYALIANEEGSAVKGLYKTKDKGATWHKMTLPSAYNMSEFTRGQAWYNLTIAVSPLTSNKLIIGGIDLFTSTNGGLSFNQITHHYGSYGLPRVHADQHEIKFINDNDALIGNDGGVYLMEDVFDYTRQVESKNEGLNITQFYACDIHPTADHYLAGSQDNGTQKFISNTFQSTEEVTGGDGARCYFDQDNPQIQITSYIHNNYFISVDGGENFDYKRFNNNGLFANPTYYDSDYNTLYAADGPGYLFRWTNPGSNGSTNKRVYVSGISNDQITFVGGTKNVEDRIYIGTIDGDVYQLDNVSNSSLLSANKIYSGPAHHAVSAIDVEDGDEDHILIGFSNYGINSLYETTNGGLRWNSCEGNLADMPVRDVMINPENKEGAIIATELGVWYTDKLNGESTNWVQSTDALPNVRVDMIKHRSFDNKLVIATHGRGLYVSSMKAMDSDENDPLVMMHNNVELTISEDQAAGTYCEDGSYEITLEFELNKAAESTIEIPVAFDYTSASENDITLASSQIKFTKGSKYASLDVYLYEDNVVEGTEYLVLEIDDSIVEIEGRSSISFTIMDNDEPVDLSTSSAGGAEYEVGIHTDATYEFPFKGYYEDQKTQLIIRAEDLRAADMMAGPITGLQLKVLTKKSDIPFTDFAIHIGHTSANSVNAIGEDFLAEGELVFMEDLTTKVGWNDFAFGKAFEWDGMSNILLQFCFNNNDWSYNDQMACESTSYMSVQYRYADSNKGCAMKSIRSLSSIRPIIQFYSGGSADVPVASKNVSDETGIGPHESAYFLNEQNQIIGHIKNLTAENLGCVKLSIKHDGNGFNCDDVYSEYCISNKAFSVEIENDHAYELSLFYKHSEVNGASSLGYKIYKTDDDTFSKEVGSFLNASKFSIESISENVSSFVFESSSSHGFAVAYESLLQVVATEDIIEDDLSLEFYPNPFQTHIYCKMSSVMEGKNANIVLYGLDGRILYSWKEILSRDMTLEVPGHLPTGSYMVKTITETGDQIQQKLIKN